MVFLLLPLTESLDSGLVHGLVELNIVDLKTHRSISRLSVPQGNVNPIYEFYQALNDSILII